MAPTESKNAYDDYECCPFKTTPGRFVGQWTKCIHGLIGRRREVFQELQEIDSEILLWKIKKESENGLETEKGKQPAFQHATPDIKRDRVTLRQVGWLGHSGAGTFYRMDETPIEPGGFTPIYFEMD